METTVRVSTHIMTTLLFDKPEDALIAQLREWLWPVEGDIEIIMTNGFSNLPPELVQHLNHIAKPQ